jgi:hypothetical protein
MNPIVKSFKAVRELGLQKIWLYTLYQVGLRTGHYRRIMPSQRDIHSSSPSISPRTSFPQISLPQKDQVIQEAGLIKENLVGLFGGPPVPLDLSLGASTQHWTSLERIAPDQDIKFIWEPARFGWAVTLARAYAFSGDAEYADLFWEITLKFIEMHPPNLGRQWQSAQEVAIRVMVWIFCDRVFATAPGTLLKDRQKLWQAIAEHAQRIPPTLVYARAQNNNHLVSEAAALYTAGLYLQNHPKAADWHETGWRWLNWAFQNQIDEFGTYTQHSTNYHRMMLQLALFTDHFRRLAGDPDWPAKTVGRLDAAVRWLWGLTDPQTGLTPNLGANDGAYIFPLTAQPFEDYRPVVDAAAKAFLNQDAYGNQGLSEMADWFSLSASPSPYPFTAHAPDMLRVESSHGRAFIHTAHYHDRPSHADQLHVDLWWQDVNVAIDPGTYLYNAPSPWDNAFARTAAHNTLLVDDHDQMQRAGRFLWLDWAQAEVIATEMGEDGNFKRVIAEHDGYRNFGIRHQRTLESIGHGWVVTDSLVPYRHWRAREHQVKINWHLPDWPWYLQAENIIQLNGPKFSFQLKIDGPCDILLFRAGECLHGKKASHPTWGWTSPTYAHKQPSLMVVASQMGHLPIHFKSVWQFKVNSQHT